MDRERIIAELEDRLDRIRRAIKVLYGPGGWQKSGRRVTHSDWGRRVSIGLKKSWANYSPAKRAARRRKVSEGQKARWAAIKSARAAKEKSGS